MTFRLSLLAAAVLGAAAAAVALPVASVPPRHGKEATLLDALAGSGFPRGASPPAVGSDGREPPKMERTPEDDEAEAAWAAARSRNADAEQDLPAEAGDALDPDDETQPVDPLLWDTAPSAGGGMLEADQREMRALLNRSAEYEGGRPLDMRSGYTDPDTVDLAYQLVKTVTDALRAAGVRHWAERSTLLAGVRQGGMLPWVAEADLGAMNEDRGRVSRVAAVLRKAGVCASEGGAVATLSWCGGPHSTTRDQTPRPYTYPFLRVWFLAWSGQGRLAGHPSSGWPVECWHAKDGFEPLRSVQFGPLTLAAGGDPAAYLTRCYGKGYRAAAGIRPEEGQLAAGAAAANGTDDDMNVFAAQPTHSLLDMVTPEMLRELVKE